MTSDARRSLRNSDMTIPSLRLLGLIMCQAQRLRRP
jgi:hypothetical protein